MERGAGGDGDGRRPEAAYLGVSLPQLREEILARQSAVVAQAVDDEDLTEEGAEPDGGALGGLEADVRIENGHAPREMSEGMDDLRLGEAGQGLFPSGTQIWIQSQLIEGRSQGRVSLEPGQELGQPRLVEIPGPPGSEVVGDSSEGFGPEYHPAIQAVGPADVQFCLLSRRRTFHQSRSLEERVSTAGGLCWTMHTSSAAMGQVGTSSWRWPTAAVATTLRSER